VISFLIIALLLTLLLWPILTKSHKQFKSKAILLAFCAASNIPVVFAVCGISILAQSREYEAWTYKATSVQHWEQWTTLNSRIETYTTGSGENQQTHTRVVYYTDKHGPYWYAKDEYGNKRSINQMTYDTWKSIWNNEKQIGFNKGTSAGVFDRKDGKIFECQWDEKFETIYPLVDIKIYENRVRQSQSVFKTKEPTKQIKKKYPLPLNKGNTDPIVCYDGVTVSDNDFLYLHRINSLLGPQAEMRLLLVLFKDSPRSIVEDVLSAWNGPNMNEFVVFAGLRENKIEWIDVQSWANQTTLHGMVEGKFLNETLDIPSLANYVYENREFWKRKSFKKDFSYIQPVAQWWSWLILVVGVVAANGIICMIQWNYLYTGTAIYQGRWYNGR
jgi:hypothetical protein